MCYIIMLVQRVWEDVKVLEMDGYNGYTTRGMYFIPLNWTLKMAKMVHFMV